MGKYLETMIMKHGSHEAFKQYLRGIASKGGSAEHTKPRGFAAMDRAKRIEVSSKGGRISRRSKRTTEATE